MLSQVDSSESAGCADYSVRPLLRAVPEMVPRFQNAVNARLPGQDFCLAD